MAENIPGVSYPLATTGEVFAGLSNSKSVTPFGLSTVTGIFQRFDNQLEAVAALGPTGNQLVMFTGSGPDGAYLFPFSSFGQSVASGNAGTLSGLLSYPSFSGRGPVELWRSGQVYSYGYGSGTELQVGSAVIAAQNNAISGDCINVYSNATVGTNLAKSGVNWYLANSITLKSTGDTILFGDSGRPMSFDIDGYGTLFNSGLNSLISIQHNESAVNIRCKDLLTSSGNSYNYGLIYHKSGALNIHCRHISGTSTHCMAYENGRVNIHAEKIISNSHASIRINVVNNNVQHGYVFVESDEIAASSADCIYMIGGYYLHASAFKSYISAKKITAAGYAVFINGCGQTYVESQDISGAISFTNPTISGDAFSLYIKSNSLINDSFEIDNYFEGGSSYVDIDSITFGTNCSTETPGISVGGGIHNLKFSNCVRRSDGETISVTNGILNILGGIVSGVQGYNVLSNISGTLNVSPDTIYNVSATTGTISYLGSSGLLNSLKTVDGSGSGLDADLLRGVTGRFPATSMIGLVPTGRQIPWFPTNATTGLLPLSSFGQSLLSGDAATATGLLGLGASTPIDSGAFQPSNSTLTGVANLNPTGNQFIVYQDSGTPTLSPVTNFGRNLVGMTGLPNGNRNRRAIFTNGSGTPYSTDNIFYDGDIFTLDNIVGLRITYADSPRVILDDDNTLGSRLLLYNSNQVQHSINTTGVQLNVATGNVRFTVHGSGQRDLFCVVPSSNRIGIANSNPQTTLDISGGIRATSGIFNDITGTVTASTGAIFQVISTGRGSIPVPVMDSARFAAINNKPTGLMAWVSDVSGIMHYDGATTTRPVMMGSGGLAPYGPTQLAVPLVGNDRLLTRTSNLTWDSSNSVLYVGDSVGGSTYTRIYHSYGIYMYSNPSFVNSILFTNVGFGQTVSNTFSFAVGGSISNLLYTRGTGVGIGTAAPVSRLDVSGSFGAAVALLTTGNSPYTPTISDYTLLCNCASGNIIVRLPEASGIARRIYNIKKIDSSAATVTISGNASQLIDGSVAQTISSQWTTLSMQAFNTGWYII